MFTYLRMINMHTCPSLVYIHGCLFLSQSIGWHVPYLHYSQVRWSVWNFSRLGYHEMHFVTIFQCIFCGKFVFNNVSYWLWICKLQLLHFLPKVWCNYQIKSSRVLWIYYCIDENHVSFGLKFVLENLWPLLCLRWCWKTFDKVICPSIVTQVLIQWSKS